MIRPLPLLSMGMAVALVVISGCGGGGAGAPAAPSTGAAPTQQVFILDFLHHTVTAAVQAHAQYVERNPISTAGNTPDLALTLTINSTRTGSPGVQQITAKVRNSSSGLVGVNDQGTVTGINLCFVGTAFYNGTPPPGSGTLVTGGGFAGYDSRDPSTGTPLYTLPQSLAQGATSNPRLVDLILPDGATTAVVTAVVQADTQRAYPPDKNDWYLTTVAGHSGVAGYRDGLAAQALFNGSNFSLYRDDVGDLLVTDYYNHCVRRIYQGQVSTFATLTGPVPPNPQGLGRDAAGNVYVADAANGSVEVMSSKGGTPTAIFQLQAPDGLAVAGNFLYACDYGLGNVDTLIHNPSGSVFTPSTWSSGAGDTHLGPGAAGVAVDAAGNGYATASGNNEISVLPFGGVWTIVAGISGTPGEKDGTGVTATFSSPAGIAVDQAGLVYVAEMNGNLRRLRYSGQNGMQYASSWIVDTLVSAGATSLDGFTGTGKVRNLRGVTCARDGTLYLTEANDLRRLDRTRN